MEITYDLTKLSSALRCSKLFALVSLITAFSFGGQALAATPGSLGVLEVPSTTPLYNNVAVGDFSDVYSFEVASDASFGSKLISISLKVYDIAKFTTSLWRGSERLGEGTFETEERRGYDYVVSYLSYSPLLPKEQYELRVGGIGIGEEGGVYAGAIALGPVVSAVPEPEIYAMMLTGLGIMGWAARRKRKLAAM